MTTSSPDDLYAIASHPVPSRTSSPINPIESALPADVDYPAIQLVPSVEPSVVFASLARGCAVEFCDDCTINILDGVHARYRIDYPPRPASSGVLERLADHARGRPDHRIRVHFTYPRASDDPQHRGEPEAASPRDPFEGVAIFVWHRRTPTRAERAMAAVLVDHAVDTVAWQRSEQAACDAAAKVVNLQVALQTSRHIGTAIGILMSLHKITRDQAFQLLRAGSQRSHRKLRDLALDVIETGCLDPAVLNHGPSSPGEDDHDPAGPRTVTWPSLAAPARPSRELAARDRSRERVCWGDG